MTSSTSSLPQYEDRSTSRSELRNENSTNNLEVYVKAPQPLRESAESSRFRLDNKSVNEKEAEEVS